MMRATEHAVSTTIQTSTHKATLLIEGWRGINHSYCVVNQQQILALLDIPSLKLFHHDLPYFSPAWNRSSNAAGLSPLAQQRIDDIPPADGAHVDCVYRISSPVVCGAERDHRKTLTFMITELGLKCSNFDTRLGDRSVLIREQNAILTPSRWSRDRIVEFGFPSEKVQIVPLGVDTTIFHPLSHDERTCARRNLGISDDETVFLNIGGGLWNKGGDVLLRGFAVLRARGVKARLIIKDQRGLYGIPFEHTVAGVAKEHPALLNAHVLSAISVISDNLNPLQLRTLYSIADCYVSPYRAEGFNLPVLEAIACGTRVIVTEGGATDDFCPNGVAFRIPGRHYGAAIGSDPGRYIEPNLDFLIDVMNVCATRTNDDLDQVNGIRQQLLSAFDWKRVAHLLVSLIDEKMTTVRELSTAIG